LAQTPTIVQRGFDVLLHNFLSHKENKNREVSPFLGDKGGLPIQLGSAIL